MRQTNKTKKSGVLRKLFAKISRLMGYELIDQSNLSFVNSSDENNPSIVGKKIINLPLGELKITRKIKSFHIILKTCTSVNLVSQNKKRIFERDKSEYTFRTINSILNSLNLNKEDFKKIKIKIFIVDFNSKIEDLKNIQNKLENSNLEFEIINLKLENFNQVKILDKNNPIIERNMKATMASIYTSFEIAKKCEDLIYFVEDDYIHKRESILEMISSYEKISSEIGGELFVCPVDYPYLYKKQDNSKIFIGNKYHWRTINESLLTFLTSKSLIEKYWENFLTMSLNEHSPFEVPLHKIFEKEICISPIPSLAMHCTNVNSIFGISPNINWNKLWKENEN